MQVDDLPGDTTVDQILAAMDAQFDQLALENAGDAAAMRENNISRALQVPAMRFLFLEREAGVPLQDAATSMTIAMAKIVAQIALGIDPPDQHRAIDDMADAIRVGAKHFLGLGLDAIDKNPDKAPGNGPHRVVRADQ
jgi:hypothetical protein